MTPKTSYILWTHGLRGPELSVLATRGSAPELNEYERRFVLAPPIPLPSDHVGFSLDALAKIYPAPIGLVVIDTLATASPGDVAA